MNANSDHSDTRLPDSILQRASLLSSTDLHEAAGGSGDLPWWIKPLDPGMRICGRAFPVRCIPGDNLALHHAIYEACPGDVLVVEAGARAAYGYWGDVMGTAAQARKLGGLVITGGVRDTRQLIDMQFPVFSGTVCIHRTNKNPGGMSAVGEPVRIGDVLIEQGDLVLGDADGVVILAKAGAADIVVRGEERLRNEDSIRTRLRDGATTIEVYGLPVLASAPSGPSGSMRRSIYVPGLSHGDLPIPVASRVANVVATGGVRGVDPATGAMPAALDEQAELMFANLTRIIETAGARIDDIVKVTIWIATPLARTALHGPWIAMFPDPASRPARHILSYELPGGMSLQCEALAVMQYGE